MTTRNKWAPSFFSALLACSAGTASADYAEDRARIEDLQARYLFAFDFGDAAGYANTFAPDGILNYGAGEIKGREAIAGFIASGRERTAEARANPPPGERPPVGRHIINNIVVTVAADGNSARGQAYWTHMTSDATGYGTVDFFGHYEDELVKIDGEWYFARRNIYNEAIPEWASRYLNPVTNPSPPPQQRAPAAQTER
jgi:hypothetical protein